MEKKKHFRVVDLLNPCEKYEDFYTYNVETKYKSGRKLIEVVLFQSDKEFDKWYYAHHDVMRIECRSIFGMKFEYERAFKWCLTSCDVFDEKHIAFLKECGYVK
jgi:hypothetical protein